MRETALPADWLAHDMEEALSDYAMSFPVRMGSDPTPLDAADAARLRAKMSARYHDWTGCDLAADLALAKQEGTDGE